ncbi:ATP-binding protein [Sulfitobacter sediminilitoris]
MTKTILESGDLRETETAYELTGPLSRVTIPATLHDSLMARIDRLQPIKEVAQMAACIGRNFDRAALEKIAGVSEQTLDDALVQLEQSELVFRRGAPPDASYVFKHALVRDVAYESLLKRRRQDIHARLVEVFEAENAAPELTAYHASQAGLTEKAAEFWSKAGSQAQARPAYDEAANHLKTALIEVGGLLDEPVWRERELELLVQIAQVYIAKEGYASAEASEAFGKAMQRIAATDSAELRVAIYYGAWIAPYIGNRLYQAYETANRLVEAMSGEAELIPRLISRRMRAATLISMGRSPEALEDLKVAYDLYQQAEITDFATKFAQDPGVQIWCYMHLAMWMCGDREGALVVADRSMELARHLNHANTFCYAGLHDITLALWEGDISRARKVTEEMRQVAIEHDMSLWKLYAWIFEAVTSCMADEADGPARVDAALKDYRATGCWLWAPLFLAEQAKAQLRAGDAAGAEAAVKRGLAEAEVCGERWAIPELHRILGDISRSQGDSAAAAKAYEQAAADARAQGAVLLLARAEAAIEGL